jgi:flavin reductase (DIM6/NTAB) family NADH-FMN oxidoreductase RutF
LAASVGGSAGQKIDKFQKLNISKEKPIKTGVLLLKDAYASHECKRLDSKIYGDHVWVVGLTKRKGPYIIRCECKSTATP